MTVAEPVEGQDSWKSDRSLFDFKLEKTIDLTKLVPEFEKNHRKVYNELLSRIRDAKDLFVLYDMSTGYPFIDHG